MVINFAFLSKFMMANFKHPAKLQLPTCDLGHFPLSFYGASVPCCPLLHPWAHHNIWGQTWVCAPRVSLHARHWLMLRSVSPFDAERTCCGQPGFVWALLSFSRCVQQSQRCYRVMLLHFIQMWRVYHTLTCHLPLNQPNLCFLLFHGLLAFAQCGDVC